MAIMTGLARLGKDAELRYTTSGEAVASLSLAFSYGKKRDGEKYRPTQWVEAALWGKRAEALAPFLLKNGLVDVVLADPHIETYQGRNGEGHKLVARVMEIELAGGGGEKREPAHSQDSAPRGTATDAPTIQADCGFGDDDIPF